MIDYVDKLLRHWAQEMSVYQRGENLGYGAGWSGAFMEAVSGAPSDHLTARGTATRSGPSTARLGQYAERVNQAIERLPPQLQEVVKVHYLEFKSATREQKAEILRCSVKTLYANIHRAHEKLSDDLPDTYVNFSTVMHIVDKASP